MGKIAIAARCTDSGTLTESVRNKDELSIEAELSLALGPYSAKAIANLAGTKLDAAKSWKAGRRCPQAAQLFRLREIPAVQRMVAARMGIPVPRTNFYADLQQLASDSTPQAAEVRAVLRGLMRDD